MNEGIDGPLLSETGLDKDRCPICGDQIDDVRPFRTNVCSLGHGPWTPAELIDEDEDYAWVH